MTEVPPPILDTPDSFRKFRQNLLTALESGSLSVDGFKAEVLQRMISPDTPDVLKRDLERLVTSNPVLFSAGKNSYDVDDLTSLRSVLGVAAPTPSNMPATPATPSVPTLAMPDPVLQGMPPSSVLKRTRASSTASAPATNPTTVSSATVPDLESRKQKAQENFMKKLGDPQAVLARLDRLLDTRDERRKAYKTDSGRVSSKSRAVTQNIESLRKELAAMVTRTDSPSPEQQEKIQEIYRLLAKHLRAFQKEFTVRKKRVDKTIPSTPVDLAIPDPGVVPPAPPVPPTPDSPADFKNWEYRAALKENWHQRRAEFEALYQRRGYRWFGKHFGLRPGGDFEAKQESMRQARNQYLSNVSEAVKARAQRQLENGARARMAERIYDDPKKRRAIDSKFANAQREGNEVRIAERDVKIAEQSYDKTKAIFSIKTIDDGYKAMIVQRFVIDEGKRLVDQQRELLSDVKRELMKRAGVFLKKHKWKMRIGSVVIAGVAVGLGAGVLAGAAAAGLRASRIAGGVGGAALAGSVMYAWTSAKVAKAEGYLSKRELDIFSSSYDDLDSKIDTLTYSYRDSYKGVRDARRGRIIKTTAATVVGGIAGGANADDIIASVDNLLFDLSHPNVVTETPAALDFVVETEATPRPDNLTIAPATQAAPAALTVPPTPASAPETSDLADETTVSETDVATTTAPEAIDSIEIKVDVEAGDTVSEMMWEHVHGDNVPDAYKAAIAEARDNGELLQKMYEAIEDLRDEPDTLKSMGISSGNIDLIYPNESINLGVLYEKLFSGVQTGGAPETTGTQLTQVEESNTPSHVWNNYEHPDRVISVVESWTNEPIMSQKVSQILDLKVGEIQSPEELLDRIKSFGFFDAEATLLQDKVWDAAMRIRDSGLGVAPEATVGDMLDRYSDQLYPEITHVPTTDTGVVQTEAVPNYTPLTSVTLESLERYRDVIERDGFTAWADFEDIAPGNHLAFILDVIAKDENGHYSHGIAAHLEQFSGITPADHQKIFEALLARSDQGYQYVAENLSLFSGLANEHNTIAEQFIQSGHGEVLAQHFEKFTGISEAVHTELANRLIESGDAIAVFENINKFSGIGQAQYPDMFKTAFDTAITEATAAIPDATYLRDLVSFVAINDGYAPFVNLNDPYKTFFSELAATMQAADSQSVNTQVRSVDNFFTNHSQFISQ